MLECARRLERETDPRCHRPARAGAPPIAVAAESAGLGGEPILVENRPKLYEPLYRACYESFPADPQAAYCHWKVVWRQYIERRRMPRTGSAIPAEIRRFGAAERGPVISDGSRRRTGGPAMPGRTTARPWRDIPITILRPGLPAPAGPELVETTESAAVRAFLSSLPWPPRRPPESFEPAPAARARIERARLLSTAGLGDFVRARTPFRRQRGRPAPDPGVPPELFGCLVCLGTIKTVLEV